MKAFARYIDLDGIKNKYAVKNPYLGGIIKCVLLIIDIHMVSKKDDTKPMLVMTSSFPSIVLGPILEGHY